MLYKTMITTGKYFGTLATIRALGKEGIETILVDSVRSPSQYSKYLKKYESCPPLAKNQDFIRWLVDYGKTHPNIFLYPCCDNTAFIYSYNLKSLSNHFMMYSPAYEIIYTILNKKHLMNVCKKIQIKTPKSYFPTSMEEVYYYADKCSYPCLIKPQTQIGSISLHKGGIAKNAKELIHKFKLIVKNNRYESFIEDFDPLVSWPMMQEFHIEAMSNTLSVAGFIDKNGETYLTRTSTKVMQKPRKIGIGLCFETTKAPQNILDQCYQLCRETGYFGAFEIEYIKIKNEYLLIDFNPRYYSQMEFEIRRGLNIPLLVYSQGVHDDVLFKKMIGLYNTWTYENSYRYSQSWLFYLTILCSLLSYNLSFKEFKQWIRWKKNKTNYVDAICDKSDIKPFFVHLLQTLLWYFKHPRSTIRHFFLEK